MNKKKIILTAIALMIFVCIFSAIAVVTSSAVEAQRITIAPSAYGA